MKRERPHATSTIQESKMFYLMWTGAETLRMHSPFPYSLLANIIRGASLVAFLNHAQVVAGRESLT